MSQKDKAKHRAKMPITRNVEPHVRMPELLIVENLEDALILEGQNRRGRAILHSPKIITEGFDEPYWHHKRYIRRGWLDKEAKAGRYIRIPSQSMSFGMAELYHKSRDSSAKAEQGKRTLEQCIEESAAKKTENMQRLADAAKGFLSEGAGSNDQELRSFINSILTSQFEFPEHFSRESVQNADGSWEDKATNRIDIYLDPDNRLYRIEDKGIGMSKDVLDKVFFNLYASINESLNHAAGKFGIGAVSFFGLGHEYVRVDSLTREGEGALAIVNGDMTRDEYLPTTRTKPGTTVEIKLSKDSKIDFGKVIEILNEDCGYIKTPLFLHMNGETKKLNRNLTPFSNSERISFNEDGIEGHLIRKGGRGRLDLLDHYIRLKSIEVDGFDGVVNCSGLDTTFSRDTVIDDPVLSTVMEYLEKKKAELNTEAEQDKTQNTLEKKLRQYKDFVDTHLFNSEGMINEAWLMEKGVLQTLGDTRRQKVLDIMNAIEVYSMNPDGNLLWSMIANDEYSRLESRDCFKSPLLSYFVADTKKEANREYQKARASAIRKYQASLAAYHKLESWTIREYLLLEAEADSLASRIEKEKPVRSWLGKEYLLLENLADSLVSKIEEEKPARDWLGEKYLLVDMFADESLRYLVNHKKGVGKALAAFSTAGAAVFLLYHLAGNFNSQSSGVQPDSGGPQATATLEANNVLVTPPGFYPTESAQVAGNLLATPGGSSQAAATQVSDNPFINIGSTPQPSGAPSSNQPASTPSSNLAPETQEVNYSPVLTIENKVPPAPPILINVTYTSIDDLAVALLSIEAARSARAANNIPEEGIIGTYNTLSYGNGRVIWTNDPTRPTLVVTGWDSVKLPAQLESLDDKLTTSMQKLGEVSDYIQSTLLYGAIPADKYNQYPDEMAALVGVGDAVCSGGNTYAAILLSELGVDNVRAAVGHSHMWLQIDVDPTAGELWMDYDQTPQKMDPALAEAMRQAKLNFNPTINVIRAPAAPVNLTPQPTLTDQEQQKAWEFAQEVWKSKNAARYPFLREAVDRINFLYVTSPDGKIPNSIDIAESFIPATDYAKAEKTIDDMQYYRDNGEIPYSPNKKYFNTLTNVDGKAIWTYDPSHYGLKVIGFDNVELPESISQFIDGKMDSYDKSQLIEFYVENYMFLGTISPEEASRYPDQISAIAGERKGGEAGIDTYTAVLLYKAGIRDVLFMVRDTDASLELFRGTPNEYNLDEDKNIRFDAEYQTAYDNANNNYNPLTGYVAPVHTPPPPPTPTPTATATPTYTATPSNTPTPSSTSVPANTAAISASPTPTRTATSEYTATQTPTSTGSLEGLINVEGILNGQGTGEPGTPGVPLNYILWALGAAAAGGIGYMGFKLTKDNIANKKLRPYEGMLSPDETDRLEQVMAAVEGIGSGEGPGAAAPSVCYGEGLGEKDLAFVMKNGSIALNRLKPTEPKLVALGYAALIEKDAELSGKIARGDL